ncbi:MAG TPA: dolichyl-phosphate beta-glucosyltransferase [Bryobacterales bacterium]|nr:dolichyl-phosphate beta-glucosyltransferase [Bryobacterales bacterium]
MVIPHREEGEKEEPRPALSVVIPVFNEETKIDADVEAALAYFRAQPYSFELIVVDDGSRDGTPAKLAQWEMRGAPHLRAICYRPNRGKGCAVRTGMLAARGERRMFADAGLCVPFSETARGLAALDEGHDVAIGSRKLAASRVVRRQSTFRHWASRLLGPVILRLMGLEGFTDTQCGFKLFSARSAEELFGRSRIDGFMFDAEILIAARRRGMRICEFPVEWRADPDSRYRPLAGGLRNLAELARIRFF